MSTWATIESEVVQKLAELLAEDAALLATVKAASWRERKALLAAFGRERLPGAYVVTTGREAGERAGGRAGRPTLTVLLADSSRRSDDQARTGGVDVTGVFNLSEQVSAALQDLLVATDRRLALVEERPVSGGEGMAAWEQSYELRRQSELAVPTLGAMVLTGEESEVHVELGALRRAAAAFSFPGVDGVFQRDLGVRGRPITWRGQLRAGSDAELSAMEAVIEEELRSAQEKTMVDSWGRSHAGCVMNSFERRGPRKRDELTGQALQDFVMEFDQLGV